MKNIFEEAAVLQKFLEEQKYRFCFIGGLALQRWGEPRVTNDIDSTLLTGFHGEERYVDTLLARYRGRIPDAREMSLVARVLLLRSEAGVGIDIALGGMPFEEDTIRRSTLFEYLPGIALLTCSAEDLVIHKTFAARRKDWVDVEGILVRQPSLDWNYIELQLRPLLDLKEEPEHWEQLLHMKERAFS